MKVEDECEVMRKMVEKMSKARLRYINNQVIKQRRRSNNPKSEKKDTKPEWTKEEVSPIRFIRHKTVSEVVWPDQYEKTIKYGLSTIGKRIWHPQTTANGNITPQDELSTLHSIGTISVASTIIAAISRVDTLNASQKRLKIFGTSLKKLDRSTSLIVALHWMLYEKRWARIAIVRCIDKPPKKKKLFSTFHIRVKAVSLST